MVRSSPYSLRHDHSRRDRWCSGYSWVMPIAPWAWWACRVASLAAWSASTLAAAISKAPSPLAARAAAASATDTITDCCAP